MNDYLEALDRRRGRKPVSQAWTSQGWSQHSSWSVIVPTWFPRHTTLLVHEDARTGVTSLVIEGFDIINNDAQDDGA